MCDQFKKHYEVKYRGEGRKEKLRSPIISLWLLSSSRRLLRLGFKYFLETFLVRSAPDVSLFLTLSLSTLASNELTN